MLFALLCSAHGLGNAELRALIGIGLEGKERQNLNELKLVESTMTGRAFVHELSDDGRRWCTAELAAGPDGRPTALERSYYLIFAALARHLGDGRESLGDLVSAVPRGRHVRRDGA